MRDGFDRTDCSGLKSFLIKKNKKLPENLFFKNTITIKQ